MNKLGVVGRVLGAVLVVDLPFTVLYFAAYAYIVGAQGAVTAVSAALIFLVRFAVWGTLATRLLGAAARLHRDRRTSHLRRAAGAAELQRADAGVQAAPTWVSGVFSAMWGLQIAVAAWVHELVAGPLTLPSGSAIAIALLVSTGAAGALAILLPLVSWIVADTAGANYVVAREIGLDLDRPRSSVPARIALLGVCLSLTPVAFMAAAGHAAQVGASWQNAQAEAEREALRAARGLEATSAEAPRLVAPSAHGQASVFRLDRAGRLESAGAPLPGWAKPDVLARAAEAGASSPEHGVALHALRLGDGSVTGAVVKLAPVSGSYLVITALVAVILLAWGPLSALLLTKSISGPLERITAATRRVVEEGDLSAIGTLPVSTLDEYGALTASTNELLDTMRKLAGAATAVAAGNLEASIEGRGELPEAFGRMLVNLRELVRQLEGTSGDLASAAVEILAATQEQEAAACSQSTGMVEVAQTMDSLAASAIHVAEAVQGVHHNAERTLRNTEQMVTRINALTAHANRIGDILDVIREIADRTDLLALNGSLEATRVGEPGRGFALVAAEMRRLAERVTASVKDIKSLVTDIRESGASTVIATEESKKLAEETTEAARGITLVTQQQRSSTDQVTQNVRAVTGVVEQAASATTQTRSAAEGLKARADRLAELVRTFRLAS